MNKIATYQDIADCFGLHVPLGVLPYRCPTKSQILSTMPELIWDGVFYYGEEKLVPVNLLEELFKMFYNIHINISNGGIHTGIFTGTFRQSNNYRIPIEVLHTSPEGVQVIAFYGGIRLIGGSPIIDLINPVFKYKNTSGGPLITGNVLDFTAYPDYIDIVVGK